MFVSPVEGNSSFSATSLAGPLGFWLWTGLDPVLVSEAAPLF